MPSYTVTDPEAAMVRARADAAAHKAAKEAPANAAKVHGEASKAAASGADSIATARDYTTAQQYSYERPPGLSFENKSGFPIGGSAAESSDVVHLGEAVSTSIAVAELRGFIKQGADGWQLTAKGKEVMAGEPGPSRDLIPGGFHLKDDEADDSEGDQVQEGADSGNAEHEQEAEEPSEAVAKAAEVLSEVPDRILERESSRVAFGKDIDVEAVAADLGITADEARERAAAVVAGFESEAAEYLSAAHGIENANEFVAWAEAHRAAELTSAKFSQVRGGQLEAYDSLARDFASASAELNSLDLASFEGTHAVEGHDKPAVVWSEEDGVFWFHHPAVGTLTLREALLRRIAQPSGERSSH
jgi:hypothetical protein